MDIAEGRTEGEEREQRGDEASAGAGRQAGGSGGEAREATVEDFESDPARNPDDERLEDIKGG